MAKRKLKDMTNDELFAFATKQLTEASVAIAKLEQTTITLARMFVTQLPYTRKLAKSVKRKVS